jgi:hypothetical protein
MHLRAYIWVDGTVLCIWGAWRVDFSQICTSLKNKPSNICLGFHKKKHMFGY